MLSRIASVLFVLFLGICGVGAYRLVEAQVAADVYRTRLAELARDYDQLRVRYDEAVRRTAVTELQVRDGALFVSIRTLDGQRETIPTPYDPSSEIYVDYAVIDGRLWIRRVFDAATPPEEALLIDSDLREIDWDAQGALHGKAAYRALSDGSWVVTVTGDGSLGLARAQGDQSLVLAAAPLIRRYDPVEAEVSDAMGGFGPGEVLRALTAQFAPRR
jgi:hypothetical protein